MQSHQYIQTAAEFQRIITQLENASAFAIDTEFDNNHYRYGFSLCLIQIATIDACYLIDPYLVTDLSALWGILENPRIEKIFHDCGEDMRLLYLQGCKPQNIFDTSVAVKLLGFEKIGLGSVLNEVLGVEFDKKKQQSNWTLRPLTPQQLDYAALDVVHLIELRNLLAQRLQSQKKREWFEQMMQIVEQKNYAIEPKTTFLNTKEQRDYSPFDQYILNELYRFRDEQAQRINRPVYQLIPEKIILDIVHQPDTIDEWLNLKGIHHRLANSASATAIKKTYETAYNTAQNLGLSKQIQRLSAEELARFQKRANHHRDVKEKVFMPIKRQIETQHGPLLTPYILSNEIINTLVVGGQKLTDIAPPYQQNIVKEAAETLQIDITAFC